MLARWYIVVRARLAVRRLWILFSGRVKPKN